MFDLENLLRTIGYVGIFGIVFAESGLLLGFFLPGDSLLFMAGLLASQGYFNIVLLCIITFAAAVLGDNAGYHIGKQLGPRLFKKPDSLFFNKTYIEKGQAFYKKHGGKTIVFARFVPIIRTFAPTIAGAANMEYKKFVVFNLLGGFAWALGFTLLGYFLGAVIPNADKYLFLIILLIIVVSIIPTAIHLLREPSSRQALADQANKVLQWARGSKK